MWTCRRDILRSDLQNQIRQIPVRDTEQRGGALLLEECILQHLTFIMTVSRTQMMMSGLFMAPSGEPCVVPAAGAHRHL